MKNILSVVLILVSLLIFGIRISKGIEFKQNVTGYLKRNMQSLAPLIMLYYYNINLIL